MVGAPLAPGGPGIHALPTDVGELQVLVVRQAEEAERMKAESTKRDLRMRHYKRRCDVMVLREAEAKRRCSDLVMQPNFRPGLRNISLYGGYTLAIRRNYSHVGAKIAAEMLAGSEVQGDLHDKKVVLLYEHKAAEAKRVRNRLAIADATATSSAEGSCSWEIYSCRGDGTQQEAIGKEKIHNCLISSAVVNVNELPSQDGLDDGSESAQVDLSRTVRVTLEAGGHAVAEEHERRGDLPARQAAV